MVIVGLRLRAQFAPCVKDNRMVLGPDLGFYKEEPGTKAAHKVMKTEKVWIALAGNTLTEDKSDPGPDPTHPEEVRGRSAVVLNTTPSSQ